MSGLVERDGGLEAMPAGAVHPWQFVFGTYCGDVCAGVFIRTGDVGGVMSIEDLEAIVARAREARDRIAARHGGRVPTFAEIIEREPFGEPAPTSPEGGRS